MEGAVVLLVVIVVAYNLFKLLARAAGGGRSSRRESAAPGRYDPVTGTGENPPLPLPPEARSLRINIFDFDDEEEESLPGPHSAPAADGDSNRIEREEQPVPETLPPAGKPVESLKKTPVAGGHLLRDVLTRERALVAAFVFHEILEPPPSLRRDSLSGREPWQD